MSEYSEIAVLAASILMLLAIVAKLIISHLAARAKKNWTRLDVTRRDIVARLKKAQLARTSAQGTLEFWERRRQEAGLKVAEMERDVEAYAEQFGEGMDDGGEGEDAAAGDGLEGEPATFDTDEGGDGEVVPAESVEDTENADAEGAPSQDEGEAAAATEVESAGTMVDPEAASAEQVTAESESEPIEKVEAEAPDEKVE